MPLQPEWRMLCVWAGPWGTRVCYWECTSSHDSVLDLHYRLPRLDEKMFCKNKKKVNICQFLLF